jgi:tetratricopeptide (TPR) repeat protein
MDDAGFSQGAPDAGHQVPQVAPLAPGLRELALKFESLGGSGRGSEFAIFQQHLGAEPGGLLAWMDLGHDLLIAALESRFDGVGLDENTIVFAPDHSDEWWTKDKRFWMARRSFVKTDAFSVDQARLEICHRLQTLREKLIADLEAGEKVFVFRNMHRNLTDAEIDRLHAAVRAYGDSTLFYVRYADADHPAGTVEAAAAGLRIGFIDHFAFSPDNHPAGPAEEGWFTLCERASLSCSRQPIDKLDSTSAPVAERSIAPDLAEPQSDAPSIPEKPTNVSSVARGVKGQRGRHIVLIGNCQMQAMAGLYRRFVAGRNGEIVEHVPSYQDLTAEHRNAIQQADVVVEQLFDLKPHVDTDALSTTTPRLFIPMVTAAFLWPFAGSAHPKNASYPFLPGGPYGGEAADSYLNRQILAGTDPEEAVETYANLDVNSQVNLNRLFEIVMDRQRSRDEAAGYRIADVMEQHFRTEQIFLSPYHPNVRISTTLASQFFAQLGARRDEIERMEYCTRVTPFPKGELPFHPSVCCHFGLDFVAPDRRYRFQGEGAFTFREYALRYMRYEWNDLLEEGLHLDHNGKPHEVRDLLIAGLQRSPLSAAGHAALGHVYQQQGAPDAAIAALRRAVELEPDSAPYRADLGNVLRQNRRLDEAWTELRYTVAADPLEPHYRVLLAHLLCQRGNTLAASDVMREAIRLDPYSPKLYADLGDFLEAAGEPTAALDAFQQAVDLAPADEAMSLRRANLLGRLNRFDEAIEVAREAIAIATNSTQARIALSDLLLRNGDPTDALNEAYVAAVTEPDSARANGHLGHVLHVIGDLPAAEAAFRRAAGLDPRNAHYRHELSSVMQHQDRLLDAIAAAREATELEPSNPHRFVHLSRLIAQGGDLVGAQTAQRGAVDLDPRGVSFRVVLSDLYARGGQLNEALTEARIAVEYHPTDVHALGHLAHIEAVRGEFDQADQTLRRALEV